MTATPDSRPPRWGIRFTGDAVRHSTLPLCTAAVPGILRVPLQQHIGHRTVPLVAAGERVLKGQPLGAVRDQTLGARVHAPSSGVVRGLENLTAPGRPATPAVVIETDGADEVWPGYPAHAKPLRLATSALRQAVIEAGIVGLGGAAFPAGLKLNKGGGVDTLILNGAECEPCINCDAALLQADPQRVLLGAQIMLRILEADVCLVAVKQGMDAAAAALAGAIEQVGDDRLRLVTVPPVYPVGGEAQLINVLTGREIPAGGLPWDSGAVCQNVATAAAVARFLTSGEPLISRIVTVTGAGVARPTNFDARIGTPVAALIAAAGGYVGRECRLIMGGAMMGVPLANDSQPVTKATNCFYVAAPTETTPRSPERPCIRCGDCATVCPVNLMPQLLLQSGRKNDFEQLEHLGLQSCIECGACDYVCPSRIPLTQQFAANKQALWERARERRQAEQAERRFSAREARLAAAAAERTAALNSQTEAPEAALAELLKRVENGNDRTTKDPDTADKG
ncbi:MAG: electron transport complex subunit RsxC [Gammaproteobacteria bacterium]|nr:electron transport complex subunit RsxC [Gammaproteobacteria bacterium]